MSALGVFAEYMRLLRLWNGFIAALAVLLGVLVATGWSELGNELYSTILGVAIVILFMGAGNALNDYFDVENDRLAHPSRPLVTGTISRRAALYSAGVLFASCLALSITLNVLWASIIALLMLGMIAYELKLKNLGFPGNLMIAFLVAALFMFGGVIAENPTNTVILASLAGLATLGREIVKDIEDVSGDISRKTLPKRIGSRNAGIMALIAIAIAVALSPGPFIQGQLSASYLIIILVADAIFIYGAFLQFRNPGRGQRLFKIAMVAALLGFVLGVPA